MPVDELLARTPAQELTDWAAYEQEAGPLDLGYRVDVAAGIISATIANAMKGKKGKRFKPADFVPNWRGREKQTWQEQLAVVEQLNRTFRGKDMRRRTRP